MSISKYWVFNALALAVAGTIAAGSAAAAPAAKAAPAVAAKAPENWSAWGGSVGVRWNLDLAGDLGLRISAPSGNRAEPDRRQRELFDVQQGASIEFTVRSGTLDQFQSGSLQARGGYVINTPAGRIDLTDFRLVPRVGQTAGTPIIDVVSADGHAWFYLDRVMYELVKGKTTLSVKESDLLISPELAARIGQPQAAGWAIADISLDTEVQVQGSDPVPEGAANNWHGTAVPGVPGAIYQADLFMSSFSFQYTRCNGCTGEGGSGIAVFTPSSTLRNNVNIGTPQPTVSNQPERGTSSALYTASIPWYEMFSGSFAPYNTDQHPYLIWNLYRINADGTIDQIGRSGTKHAFLTLNSGCLENPNNSHILGRGCGDTYATGNNDSSADLGPRKEIIPATNQWGRCGSIFDPDCNGSANSNGVGSYDQRLTVRESQFSGPANAGATYLFESWYLAREDINVFNSMGTTNTTFTRNGSTWSLSNSNYKLGPAIDRWVNPFALGTNERNVTVATPQGQVKVAMKATSLGSGQWRYDYAVMNVDYANAVTSGTAPNLRIVSTHGLSGVTIPLAGSTLSGVVFSDGDLDANNDWAARTSSAAATWTAGTTELTWGVMYRFSFVANKAPGEGTIAVIGAAEGGLSQPIKIPGLLVPQPGGIPTSGKAGS